MKKETLEYIDKTIETLCKEMETVSTDKMIALAETLGTILIARARLAED